jgi:hypothetical protein
MDAVPSPLAFFLLLLSGSTVEQFLQWFPGVTRAAGSRPFWSIRHKA